MTRKYVAVIRYDLTTIEVTKETLLALNAKNLIESCTACSISTDRVVYHPSGFTRRPSGSLERVPEILAVIQEKPKNVTD